ncbi:MAG: OmpA family protein [Deltaproteobacteria bacterium]|nr:OmpA family protein [Deltaproteobacteria bacterium]
MRSRFSVTIAPLVCVALMTVGCSVSPKSPERKTNKTAGGSFTGKTISKEMRKRALKESGIRTLSFGSVSAYMDYQETKLRQRLKRTGVRISRAGHNIILTMPGNITFDFGSANLKSEFYEVLNSVALVLEEYDRTYIDVYGHTDSIGSHNYNNKLSKRRAGCVAEYLVAQGCNGQRFSIQGFGESKPIASNNDKSGRARNRRVEIEISPLT